MSNHIKTICPILITLAILIGIGFYFVIFSQKFQNTDKDTSKPTIKEVLAASDIATILSRIDDLESRIDDLEYDLEFRL